MACACPHALANGYILGGNIHQNYVDNGGHMRTATNEPKAWLFSIKPNNPNKVEIAPKYNGISGGWRAYVKESGTQRIPNACTNDWSNGEMIDNVDVRTRS